MFQWKVPPNEGKLNLGLLVGCQRYEGAKARTPRYHHSTRDGFVALPYRFAQQLASFLQLGLQTKVLCACGHVWFY
jgi:hypothetical protein